MAQQKQQTELQGWRFQEPFTSNLGRTIRGSKGTDDAVFILGRDGQLRFSHAITYGNRLGIDAELATRWFGEGFSHRDASGMVVDPSSALAQELNRRMA